jgi:TPR repeat protein
MKKQTLAVIGCWLLCLGFQAQATDSNPSAPESTDRMLSEQKHFAECLACVYGPGWWLSYNDALYFQPRSEAQFRQLETMKEARSRYVALTNHEARHALAAKLIASSGISEAARKKLLLPFSTTNQTLTPTLNRPLRVVPAYKVLQSFANGDALIQDDAATLFVMNFGGATAGASGTNALLIKEGTKTYASGGAFKTVEAFTNVAPSPEETAVLNRVVAACQKEAAALTQQIAGPKAREEFEACKARATDSNPYMQFLLAKAYLEGKGTEKDEKLGLEWMRRAAKSGSGDATSYLETLGRKAP